MAAQSACSGQTVSDAQLLYSDDSSSIESGPPAMPYTVAAVLAVSTGLVTGAVVMAFVSVSPARFGCHDWASKRPRQHGEGPATVLDMHQ